MSDKKGIFRLINDKPDILRDVSERVFTEKQKTIDFTLGDAAYNEIKRLEKIKDKDEKKYLKDWRNTHLSILKSSESVKERKLKEIIDYYTNDIAGNFDPKVYKFSTSLLPMFMSVFFRTITPKSVVMPPPEESDIDKIVMLRGRIKELQELSKNATIILVPTHSSNMDSIVIGWALYRIGLPPFTYGAGKNLFTNPILSYFMHNLGAYRVDRRIKHKLYKDILKTYSMVVLERDFHSLFFPGGTRSRSNKVDSKLKLGLLGTGIQAYINNLKKNKENPDIFVVPCTINYHIVLEAETLIKDYLQEKGKERFVITKDESSSYPKVLNFLFKMARMESHLYINFGHAYDLFGNKVNTNGESYDPHGRIIDRKSYVSTKGEVFESPQRDFEYTKLVGEKIVDDYYENNIPLPTNILSFCLFQYLRKKYNDIDLYKLVHISPKDATVSFKELLYLVEKVKNKLLELSNNNKVTLEEKTKKQSSEEIIKEALNHFTQYYRDKMVTSDSSSITVNNVKLLYYYQNRLDGYDLENLF